jgi:hypothetical protein
MISAESCESTTRRWPVKPAPDVHSSWDSRPVSTVNPITNEEITVRRRRIRTEYDLPMKDDYDQFVRSIISQPQT